MSGARLVRFASIRRPWLIAACVLASLPTIAQAAAPPAAESPSEHNCIAVVLPGATGVDGDATQFASSLRELIVSYLTGPSLRAVPLESRLPSQAVEEAKRAGCGHVLLTSVGRKRNEGSRLGRALQQAAGPAAFHAVPYAGGAAGAVARGAAVGGAYAISSMAQTARAKDEVALEYRLGPADAAMQATPQHLKARAERDGEDLLTPLVAKAAESIAAAVLAK